MNEDAGIDDDAKIRQEVGIPWHRKKFHPRGWEIQLLQGKGYSWRQIAEYFGVSTVTVWRRLKSYTEQQERYLDKFWEYRAKNPFSTFTQYLQTMGIRNKYELDAFERFYKSRVKQEP